jgi:DNA-binding beta-propeller fold protein YncE
MTMGSVISSFTLDIDALGWTGQDLQRPESVVAEPNGTLWASDGRGGVTRIDPDGGQVLLAGFGGEPNGLAIDPGGNLVTANIALVSCGVDSLAVSGDGVEDFVGGLGPHKRPWVLVPGVDPGLDRVLEFGH